MQNTNTQNYQIHKFWYTNAVTNKMYHHNCLSEKKNKFSTEAWPATSNGQIYFTNNWLFQDQNDSSYKKVWLKINCLICVGKTQNHRCLALHRSTKYLCQNTQNLWHRYTDSVYLCILFCVFVFSALLH